MFPVVQGLKKRRVLAQHAMFPEIIFIGFPVVHQGNVQRIAESQEIRGHAHYRALTRSVSKDPGPKGFCLSSQSEVAKPLPGWHAKSLTNIKSAFTSEPKTLDYKPKLRNI